MVKRSITTAVSCLAGCLLMASVVFTGVNTLAGKWRLVELYGSEVGPLASPITLEFNNRGALVGHSSCGLFTGRWRACEGGLRIKDLVPSKCGCGELRAVESKLLDAMGQAEQHRVGKNSLVLMHQGRTVAVLVPLG